MAFWKYVAVGLVVACGLFARPAFALDEQTPGPATSHKDAPAGMIQPCGGKIRLRGLNFDNNDSTIHADHSVMLDQVAQFLQERCAGHSVLIEGFSDALGSAARNQELSEKRAEAVKNYLVEKGVPAAQLSTVGYGERRPIASSNTEAGRALNRRATLRFTDKAQ